MKWASRRAQGGILHTISPQVPRPYGPMALRPSVRLARSLRWLFLCRVLFFPRQFSAARPAGQRAPIRWNAKSCVLTAPPMSGRRSRTGWSCCWPLLRCRGGLRLCAVSFFGGKLRGEGLVFSDTQQSEPSCPSMILQLGILPHLPRRRWARCCTGSQPWTLPQVVAFEHQAKFSAESPAPPQKREFGIRTRFGIRLRRGQQSYVVEIAASLVGEIEYFYIIKH